MNNLFKVQVKLPVVTADGFTKIATRYYLTQANSYADAMVCIRDTTIITSVAISTFNSMFLFYLITKLFKSINFPITKQSVQSIYTNKN